MSQYINDDENDVQLTDLAGVEQSDGIDVEFSQALADHDDLVAQERSKAADQRAKTKQNKR